MPSDKNSATAVPISVRLQSVVMTAQFCWFLGHFTTVFQTILSVIYGPSGHYYKAYYGALLSYGIILYKSHGIPTFNSAYAQRILSDESSLYFVLAFVWVTSNPVLVTLIPYATFSLFHVSNYIQNEFIPKVFPGNTVPMTASVISVLSLVSSYQSKALPFVAYSEVWIIFPMLLVSILWPPRVSFFTPFLYFNFLSFRFYFSQLTKAVVRDLETKMDAWIGNNPSIPPTITQVYEKVKSVVKSYGDLEARARAAQGQTR